jgi:hypothetical protein
MNPIPTNPTLTIGTILILKVGKKTQIGFPATNIEPIAISQNLMRSQSPCPHPSTVLFPLRPHFYLGHSRLKSPITHNLCHAWVQILLKQCLIFNSFWNPPVGAQKGKHCGLKSLTE